jgi:hypothetical protein
MKKIFLPLILLVLAAFSTSGQAPHTERQVADVAWDAGDYITALSGYIRLLGGPSADQALEPIALQTGELFTTHEITADGLAPRLSPDGRLVSYESGAGAATRTRVVQAAEGHAPVAEFTGRGASFSPAGDRVVYLRPALSDDVVQAQKALDALPADSMQRAQAGARVNWLLMTASTLVVRDLASGRESELRTDGLLKAAPVWSADGKTVYFIGARENDASRSDVYQASENAAPERLTDADGVKLFPIVDPTGAYLLYTVGAMSPFGPPATPGGAPGGRPAGPPTGPAVSPQAGAAQAGQAPRFGIVHLATRRTNVITGSSPTMSADGSAVAYLVLAREAGHENTLFVMPAFGTPVAVKTTTDRLASPALSPDGRRVAFQMMPREDWEFFIVNADGTSEVRVTREIQHDVQPMFLTTDLLLGVMGEPRHRRSYLYDLKTGARMRLFHNNTVRTIAPEYAWAASRDGSTLVISAERDGDTVSPERGVYLMNLTRKVTKEQVLARLKAALAAETDLRDRGRRMFQPIAAQVRQILGQASVSRVYGYEKDLYAFDSKHISRPGNRKAIEYLTKTYETFGYKPEQQWFAPRGALDGKSANVLATLKGTENPDLIYVVSSHFDSNANCAGADDDTSGTAALLEAARLLAKTPMPATIVFASFTGEEAGLLGSREYVRQAVEKKLKVVGALNNDMIGWANDHRLDNTIRYSNRGIRDVQHAAAMQFTKLITYDALYFKGTDANAYFDAWGDIVGGIGSYPVLASPHYHQPHDQLETVNHELVTEVAKTTAATLMYLASSPSRLKDVKVERYENGAAELSWTAPPEQGVREYIIGVGSTVENITERLRVNGTRARVANVKAGSIVGVKAVNRRRLEGWDWGRATVK